MSYLPWADSLPEGAGDPAGSPGGSGGPGDPEGLVRPRANSVSRSQPGARRQAGPGDRAGPGGAGAFGQAISNRLFSAGLDLHFTLMTLDDGPGRRRVEHAITEIDDAIRDLRHLMIEISKPLAWPLWLLTLP